MTEDTGRQRLHGAGSRACPETLHRHMDCFPPLPLLPGGLVLQAEAGARHLTSGVQVSNARRSQKPCTFRSSSLSSGRRLLTTTSPFIKEQFSEGFHPLPCTLQSFPTVKVRSLVFFHHNFLASDSTWPQVTSLFYFLYFFVFVGQHFIGC